MKYGIIFCVERLFGKIFEQCYDIFFLDDEVFVECLQNDMFIVIFKFVFCGIDCEYIRVLDVNCGVIDNLIYFIFDVLLIGCGIKSRYINLLVIYSNEVLFVLFVVEDIVFYVFDFQILFYCYYDNEGLVLGVGFML